MPALCGRPGSTAIQFESHSHATGWGAFPTGRGHLPPPAPVKAPLCPVHLQSASVQALHVAAARPAPWALSPVGPCSAGGASRDRGLWARSGGPGRSLRLRLSPWSQAANSRQGNAAPGGAPRPGRGQCLGLGGDRELSAWQRPRVAGLARAPGRVPAARRRGAGDSRAGSRWPFGTWTTADYAVQRPRRVRVPQKVAPKCSRHSVTPEPGAAGKRRGRVWRLRPRPHDGAGWLPAPRAWGSSLSGAHRACRADPQICILSGDKICSRIFSRFPIKTFA